MFDQPGRQRVAQKALLLGERIANLDRSGLAGAAQRVRDDLAIAEAGERLRDRVLHVERRARDLVRRHRGNDRGDSVVAFDARDLFDEIGGDGQIAPPRGGVTASVCAARVTRPRSRAREDGVGDSSARRSATPAGVRPRQRAARSPMRGVERAAERARSVGGRAEFAEQLCRARGADIGQRGRQRLLVARRSLGAQSERARSCAGRAGR